MSANLNVGRLAIEVEDAAELPPLVEKATQHGFDLDIKNMNGLGYRVVLSRGGPAHVAVPAMMEVVAYVEGQSPTQVIEAYGSESH